MLAVMERTSVKRLILITLCLAYVNVFAAAQATSPAPAEKATIASRTAGLAKRDGFFPYYWDDKKGVLLLEISPQALNRDFLYFTGLGSGVGSIEVFADRSSFGHSAQCSLRRVGSRVLVVEENTNFRAENGSKQLQYSVRESFPTSVLASLPIEAEQNGTLLVDATNLLVRDAADLLSQLRRPTRAIGGAMIREESSHTANWQLDKERSVVDLDHSGSFPLNTEIEILLTFATDAESDLNQPNPHALSVREHHSFLAMPDAGYEVRVQDPRVGFFGVDFDDFSQPYDQPLARHLISRWRLKKKDPTAALSEPVKPIVFYLDTAIPEPVRSAAKQGALWWNAAFEQAGFKNALHVEDLPEGADPMDVRFPTIQWTNRSGRGWSVGQTQVDPRTGEILHAVVQLDSHRMRTVNNYWQATIPSGRDATEPTSDLFAALDNLDPNLSEQGVLKARLALLTCHEVGHALGLEHNFVASTYGRGSVMDYYGPRVKIRADGSADLSDAYMQGVGSYDRFAIEWGYSEGKSGASTTQERARLDAMVKASIAKRVVWGNYQDPRWNAYDDGSDPVTWLKDVLPVRDALLTRYGASMLRPGEPNSRVASRFALVYLFHRYALAAAINVVGSAEIPLSLAGDGQPTLTIWPADRQKEALRLAVSALDPSKLEVPAELWTALVPTENSGDDPERFSSSAGYLFSPQDGARAVGEVVVGGLLNPERMQRLLILSKKDTNAPSPSSVIDSLLEEAFTTSAKSSAQQDLQGVVQAEVAERLMRLAVNPEATPEVQAAAFAGVRRAQQAVRSHTPATADLQRLDHEIELFLVNPAQNIPKIRNSGAPPGPPV
jgi:hypothetical protein